MNTQLKPSIIETSRRLPKYFRTDETRQAFAHRPTTDIDLEIIDTINRYRIIPTELLIHLIPAHRSTIHDRLQTLYHRGLVNRLYIPRIGYRGQNNYYLDNPKVIDLFKLYGRPTSHFDRVQLRRNEEKNHAAVNDPAQIEEMQGRLLFLKHELMISRFHALVELACSASDGRVELIEFAQGRALKTCVTVGRYLS